MSTLIGLHTKAKKMYKFGQNTHIKSQIWEHALSKEDAATK
jgi:hypothetical protein